MKQESKKKFFAYLLWAFGVAWALQLAAGLLYRQGNMAA